MDLQKTDLTDRVVEKMTQYLEQEGIGLIDLDLSRNLITDEGLTMLSTSLKANQSLKYLNLKHNRIREEGLKTFAEYLTSNTTLLEVSLSENALSVQGIKHLSAFLPRNTTLKLLELVKCTLTDAGFSDFASALGKNNGIEILDISRNRDITDEGSLLTLAKSLRKNQSLKTLTLGGLTLRKTFCKDHLLPAL